MAANVGAGRHDGQGEALSTQWAKDKPPTMGLGISSRVIRRLLAKSRGAAVALAHMRSRWLSAIITRY